MRAMWLIALVIVGGQAWAAEGPAPVLGPVGPSDVVLRGYLGGRLDRNLRGILLHKDEGALLDPFRHRKGSDQAWAGEHVGKWLSAAAMMYGYSHDAEILAKLRRVADELAATQLADGYLGTYIEKDRWTSWDVWVHKYNLLGLGAYYDATADPAALAACRRIGDLLIGTFGAGRRDILKAGEHQGMASASILEPMLWLYRRTGDRKYFEFAEYIVASLEREGGPRIVSTLLRERTVRKVSDAKGYEMLSCLVGLLEMYRITGDARILEAARIACDDITQNLIYITGGATYGEAFCEPGVVPNAGHVAETCVTMSLMQLYAELLQLTGEAKYGNAAEQLIFNHLLACQKPDGRAICYYTPLWGTKFYMDFLGCCISSGPRAIAMIPSMSCLTGRDRVVVNLLGAGELRTRLAGGDEVRVVQTTDYPFSEKVRVQFSSAPRGGCVLAVRIPPTAHSPRVMVDGKAHERPMVPGAHLELNMSPGDHTIELDLGLKWEIIKGNGANDGLFALRYGPVVFAVDADLNDKAVGLDRYGFDMDVGRLAPALTRLDSGWVAQVNGFVRRADGEWSPQPVKLRPYADAGLGGGSFSVWLQDRSRSDRGPFSLFTQAHQAASRAGKNRGSITDNSPLTFTTTDDGKRSDEDFFEINAGWHTSYNVIVFRHGKAFANGGWFDTSKGKPKVLLKSWKGYHQVAVIEDYPDTTAESPGTLTDGQAFRVIIPKEKREPAFFIRVSGVPAHGKDASQNFTSCSEIQVFHEPNE